MKTQVVSTPSAQVLETEQVSKASQSHRTRIISGFHKDSIEFAIRGTLAMLAMKNYSNPLVSLKTLKSLDVLRRDISGPHRIMKLARVSGKFYWDMYTPGWPSRNFDSCMLGEMNRISPIDSHTNRFTNVFLAITKKCPLQCEHCFEWKALNKHDNLTLDDIKAMVSRFQKMGSGQIQLTGGEPLLRVSDIVEVLEDHGQYSDFWILTSGYSLTEETAILLKRAGLVGVAVSLDDVDSERHNMFRGYSHSFEWVQRAIKSALNADLVTALSLCATRKFVTPSNLMAYADLAKEMGVAFIQILEPKAVGHYEGLDVSLGREQETMLEDFTMKLNYNSAFQDYPIVCYHGYHQRRTGCFASGNRNLYVDTDGDIHACPFCHKKSGSALGDNLEQSIELVKVNGCHTFKGTNH